MNAPLQTKQTFMHHRILMLDGKTLTSGEQKSTCKCQAEGSHKAGNPLKLHCENDLLVFFYYAGTLQRKKKKPPPDARLGLFFPLLARTYYLYSYECTSTNAAAVSARRLQLRLASLSLTLVPSNQSHARHLLLLYSLKMGILLAFL